MHLFIHNTVLSISYIVSIFICHNLITILIVCCVTRSFSWDLNICESGKDPVFANKLAISINLKPSRTY